MSDKAVRGFGSQTLIVIGIGVVNLLYFSIMSRLLNKEDFGYFAIINAITTILDEISTSGLGSAIIQRKTVNKKFFHCAFTLSLIIGLFFTSLLFLSANKLSHLYVGGTTLIIGFKIISITFLSHNITSSIRALYIRKMYFFRYGCYQLSALIISCVIGVLLAFNKFGFLSIIIASTVSPFLLAVFLVIINREELGVSLKKSFVSEILSYGGWLTASGIVRSIYDQLDKLITTNWIHVSLLGAYNRPVGFISQVSGQINGVFDTVLFPILSSNQDNTQKLRNAYMVCTELIFVPATIIAFCFALSSHLLISIFLGEKWLDLVPVFQIASISMVFMFYNRIGDCFFRSMGIVKDYFMVRVVICVFSVICIYIGCKNGIMGLVISVLSARLIESLFKTFFFSKKLGLNVISLTFKVLQVCMVPIVLFVILFLLMGNQTSIWSDCISLSLFVVCLAVSIKIYPSILGKSFNKYIISKYLNKWI